jgi:hypothetical protein
MTIPYNISMTGIGEQIPETATINGQKCYLYSKYFGELTKVIYEVLTKDILSLKKI